MSSIAKDNLVIRGAATLPYTTNLQYSEPLWKRVPTRDSNGQSYNDFMMVIPGLRDFEAMHFRSIVNNIENILTGYAPDVILAELNLKMNVLWVTLQPHISLSIEIAALIHHVIPEAKLVAQHRV